MGKINLWTVVQHSAVLTRHAEFVRGLETAIVDNAKDRNAIRKAGGLLFDTWVEADDYAEEEMFREVPEGLIPRAPGTFASHKIDGLAVYVPRDKVTT